MKLVLIIFLLLPSGEMKMMNMRGMDSMEACVSEALVINQDADNKFNAGCVPVLERGLM